MTLGKETILLRGSCYNLRYKEIVKGFPKIPGVGYQVDGAYVIKTENTGKAQEKRGKDKMRRGGEEESGVMRDTGGSFWNRGS